MNYSQYKIIIIGDSGIGKTTIVNSYLNKNNNNPISTIGTEYSTIISSKYNQELHIWDCAGQEKFRSLVKLYYRGAKACIFTFDLNNIKSLYSINDYWIKTVKQNSDEDCIYLLVGNKSDLKKNTDYNLINKLYTKYNINYIESCALTNKNINIIFETISDILYAKYILNKKVYYTNNLINSSNINNENININNKNNENNENNYLKYKYTYC